MSLLLRGVYLLSCCRANAGRHTDHESYLYGILGGLPHIASYELRVFWVVEGEAPVDWRRLDEGRGFEQGGESR